MADSDCSEEKGVLGLGPYAPEACIEERSPCLFGYDSCSCEHGGWLEREWVGCGGFETGLRAGFQPFRYDDGADQRLYCYVSCFCFGKEPCIVVCPE